MPLLHDPATRTRMHSRLQSLRPDAPRRWGRMTVDQMLWHVNSTLEVALGRRTAAKIAMPLPLPIMRFLVLYGPWPHGAPTMPEVLASEPRDFEAERTRCLALIDELARKNLSGAWPVHPMLGPMSGRGLSRLHAKHVDHHLRQFGA